MSDAPYDFDRPLTELEEAQSIYSDFYKDVNGFRPRNMSTEQWESLEWVKGAIQKLHDGIEARKGTFAGREGLREDGWHVPETDPVLIQQAEWLKQERDRAREERYAAIENRWAA
jgi:hypothetical protein